MRFVRDYQWLQLHPRHKHPGDEIIYIIQGSIEYELDGQSQVTL